MAQWLGPKKIVFIPMIRPTDPPMRRTAEAINQEVFRKVLFNPTENNRTFVEHVSRSSHGRASVEAVFLPAQFVPWSDLRYGSTTPEQSDNGVDYAIELARQAVAGTPGVDYYVCSIGQGNDSEPGYTGVPGVGGTARPAKGWFRTHVQAAVGEYLHEALHTVCLLGHYYEVNPSVAEYDPMADTRGAHPTVFTKRLLGWVPREDIISHRRTGTVSYWVRHQGIFGGSTALGPSAVSVVDSASSGTYYIESRRPVDQFESVIGPGRQGVIIYEVEHEDTDPGTWVAPVVKLRTQTALQSGNDIVLADGRIRVAVTTVTPQAAQVSITTTGGGNQTMCSRLASQIEAIERDIERLDPPSTPAQREQIARLQSRLEILQARYHDAGCE